MKCVKCKSKETRVTCTVHQSKKTIRYCRCLDCKFKFKTEEKYVKYEKPFRRNVKLNVEKVKEIRANKVGRSIRELSIEYDVDPSTIKNILAKRTWKHID